MHGDTCHTLYLEREDLPGLGSTDWSGLVWSSASGDTQGIYAHVRACDST